jgi:hypothetical protein
MVTVASAAPDRPVVPGRFWELETVADGGISTRGLWAGRARHKRTRRPPA